MIRDPKEAFLRTVNDTSNTIAAQRLYGEVARSLGRTTFGDGLSRLQQGQRPIIDGNNLTDQMVAQLEGFGYVRAGELNPERAFGGKFGSLSGDFIPVEVYNSLTTPMRSSSSVQEALAVFTTQGFITDDQDCAEPLVTSQKLSIQYVCRRCKWFVGQEPRIV